jgi:hypothetical protein
VNEQVTAEEIRTLLRAYAVALDAAESLPPLVRIASRPRRWTLFEPLRRLPRHTIGTSTMVTYHVQRSTTALMRRYARIKATRGLTDEDERASGLVTTFRESLAPVRWTLILPALLIAALVTIQIVLGVVAWLVEFLTYGSIPRLSGDQQERLSASVKRVLSPILGPDAFSDLFTEIGKAGLPGVLTLTGTVIAAAYLVFRPLSPAFRVKRTLFNLAPTGSTDLAHTTTTWNVTRSGRLYDLERTLLIRLGARPPNETAMDIWLGAIATAGLTGIVLPWFVGNTLATPESIGFGITALGFAAGLAVARGVWLWQTTTARRRGAGTADPPVGFVAPHSQRVVEARSVVETASLGALSNMLTFLLFFIGLPSPVWVRLIRERRDLERAQRRAYGTSGRLPSRRVWPAIGSAMLLWPIPPVPVAIHLTRLIRLVPPDVGSARRTRAWLVPLLVAATPLPYLDLFYLAANDSRWVFVTLLPTWAVFALAFGAVQHTHNTLIRHIGTPLPCDDPLWKPERTAEEQRERVLVPSQDSRGVTLVQSDR